MRHNHRAVGWEGARAGAHPVCRASVEGPGAQRRRRLTHSIKEVSELVLLKAGSQKVIWGLQYTLFEPKGVDGCLQGRIGSAAVTVAVIPSHQLSPNTMRRHVTNR